MPSPTRLLALAALLVSATAIIPTIQQGPPDQTSDPVTPPTPDNDLIAQTVNQVNQKTAPPTDAAPDAAVPPTGVTAVGDADGTVTVANATIQDVSASNSTRRRDIGRFGKRQSGFKELFSGLAPGVHDASIEGTAYLTYTVVDNSTYNVQACLDYCAGIEGCVFVNLFYEFNNALLDFVFSQKSNLKCAAYGDIHNATEKTNFGGQASYSQVGNETVPLTYITQSSGWGLDKLLDPATPDGYDLVFGPTGGANNAPGYMGFAFIDQYDVNACAQLCNGRGVDPNGGGCAYFNIWRAVVDGVPTTYTCSMYYLVADASTAVNYGQGDLVVTYSRGYARTDYLVDGGFEGYTACDNFCYTASYANWIGTTPNGGDIDAIVFYYKPYAHTGHGSGELGSGSGHDNFPGTLTSAEPLKTEAGKNYVVQCFMASSYSGPQNEAAAHADILWNGVRIGGTSNYTQYAFVEGTAVGTGSDTLSFHGGAFPAYTFIDDCHVYQA
ncbi:hypothetical protein K438DRAFT_2082563 [Mycena galopus ATCC 62051]|nr:hypothetical protein K438DRAFT_2082563 [Mycena galopus ATCC 62051]